MPVWCYWTVHTPHQPYLLVSLRKPHRACLEPPSLPPIMEVASQESQEVRILIGLGGRFSSCPVRSQRKVVKSGTMCAIHHKELPGKLGGGGSYKAVHTKKTASVQCLCVSTRYPCSPNWKKERDQNDSCILLKQKPDLRLLQRKGFLMILQRRWRQQKPGPH